MIDFSKEHPEVVRLMAQWMQTEIIKTRKEVDILRASIELKKQLGLTGVSDQLLVCRKLIFGRGNEKRPVDRERDTEGAQLLLHSQSLVPPIKDKQVEKLLEDVILHTLSDAELLAESKLRELSEPSATQWDEVANFYDESTEVTIVERQYKLEKHRRQKYKLKPEFCTDKEVIITAAGPDKLLPGCTYSIDLATSVVSDKYVNHLPLERQSKMMESLGLKSIHTKTLYNLCMAVGVHMEPIAAKICQEILLSGLCVHSDETPWPIQIKQQDDGYMWVISNQAGSFYRFEPTRSGKVIEETFKNYSGPVLTDGYAGYNRLKAMPGITLANCWAHARRKFIDIEENYPTETAEILNLMGKLFAIEHQAKSFSELAELRRTQSAQVIAKIKNWLMSRPESARAESYLKSAILYCVKYWDGLTKFIDDARIPLTNNEAERTIRHAVMGRKNFYGSRTHNGADIAATLYTIVESCKKVQIDPRSYINMAVKLSAKSQPVPTPLEYARISRAN